MQKGLYTKQKRKTTVEKGKERKFYIGRCIVELKIKQKIPTYRGGLIFERFHAKQKFN